jgi:tRNA-specific 2-thiouridylase
MLRDVNWLGTGPEGERRVAVKLRSAQPPQAATFSLDGTGGVAVLDEPVLGVAPGQACVIYDGTRVLGGGTIMRAPKPAATIAASVDTVHAS